MGRQNSIKWTGNGNSWLGSNYELTERFRRITREKAPRGSAIYNKIANQSTNGYWKWQDKQNNWHAYSAQVNDYINCMAMQGRNNFLIDCGENRIFKIDFTNWGSPTEGTQISTKYDGQFHKMEANGSYKETMTRRAIRKFAEAGPAGSQRVRISMNAQGAVPQPQVSQAEIDAQIA